MKNTWKRLLSVLLAVVMTVGLVAVPAMADENPGKKPSFTWEKVDNAKRLLPYANEKKPDDAAVQYKDSDVVRVSIVFDGKPAIGIFSTDNIGENEDAIAYCDNLKEKQESVVQTISRKALKGQKLDIVWNLTLVANLVSANVPYGSIDAIKSVEGVKEVYIETRYEPAAASAADSPNQAAATGMTGATEVWSDYTGAGSIIAIIDTGLDTDHELFDAGAFNYAIKSLSNSVKLLNKSSIALKWNSLHASEMFGPTSAGTAFLSDKIPFAFNYVDRDFDVIHANDNQGEHGSHVAGIAAANRFVEVNGSYEPAIDAVKTQGVAPDAQVLVMKVFGKNGGAYDSDYMVAIEDAIVLGADSVNLSLGSAAPGFATNENSEYQAIMDNLTSCDTTVTISMGNSGGWADKTRTGYLNAGDANFYTGGSPGSYANAFTVASVDNIGVTGPTLEIDGSKFSYNESTDYGNEPISTIAGEHEFIYIDSAGTEAEFAAAAEAGLVEGKIAVCNRGSISFYVKANAAAANGAVGVIVANNQEGTIYMNLTGYEYTIPAVTISQADAAYLKTGESGTLTVGEDEVAYYTGTITVSDGIDVVVTDTGYYTMSDFSSWGVPGDLSLKPEITAPGGGIYSLNGYHRQLDENGRWTGEYEGGAEEYETMSGTSMAAPQVTGLAALVAQYVRENDLAAKTGKSERFLVQSLLMSTAEPLTDEYGKYYSVLKQGSGLARVDAAVSARSYIEMDEKATKSAADGKVKVELGDDPDRTGEYSFKFTINNFSDENVTYDLSADFFTQLIYDFGTDMEFRTEYSQPILAEVEYKIDGEVYVDDDFANLVIDINGDKVFNALDAQAVLDYVVKGTEMADDTYADFDGDGEITTYDAYLILSYTNAADLTVPAGGSKEVEVSFALYNIYQMENNGNYVEGYVYATARPTASEEEEGIEASEVHSIPVLGYYGSWLEPNMLDTGYIILNAQQTKYIYLGVDPTFYASLAGESGTYALGGNPFVDDDEYMPERNSVSSDATVAAVQFSAIRNYGQSRLSIINNGALVGAAQLGNGYGAYYYENGSRWMNTSATKSINYPLTNTEDGDELVLNLALVPEYYLEDGVVDWDTVDSLEINPSLYSITYSAVIDNTAPVFVSAEPVYETVTDEETETTTLTGINVTASDNRYVAAVVVCDEDYYFGEDGFFGYTGSDAEAEAGAESVFAIRNVKSDNVHFLVQIFDYAGNTTTYKLNLNWEAEKEEGIEVVLSETEATIVNYGSVQLSADVYPWGTDESVTWTSDSEAITVDETGLVTNVSAKDGDTATITATSVADPTVSASCKVTVVFVHKDLNGVVWDENGEVWFAKYDIGALPEYEKLNNSNLRLSLSAATYDENGTLYAASFDSNDWSSTLYTVDESSYELTEVGTSEYGFMDICAAPSIGDNLLLAIYGSYVLIIDRTSAQIEGVFDFSEYTGGNNFVGIAYEEQYEHSAYGNTDWVFLLDETGTLYEEGFVAFDGDIYNFGGVKKSIGTIGKAVDIPYWQSLYFDGESLYWNRFNYDDNKVDVICVNDIYNDGSVYNLGSFADGVWPVAATYESGVNPATGFKTEAADRAVRNAAVAAACKPAESLEKIDFTKAPAGKLNGGEIEERVVEDTSETVTIKVTADEASNNGLIVVAYDENLTYVSESVSGKVELNSIKVDETAKTVTIGYATVDEVAEGDVIATLQFTRSTENDAVVSVATFEINDNFEASEPVEIELKSVNVTGVSLPETLAICVGDTAALTAVIEPEDAMNKAVTWASSDETVATVDETGKVSGVADGEATITVTTVDGGFTAECVVTVTTKAVTPPVPIEVPTDPTKPDPVVDPTDPTEPIDPTDPTDPTEPTDPENPDGSKKFIDVTDESAYYYTPVYWAVEKGITKGKTADTFDPNGDCTRAQIVTFLYRAMGEPEVDTTENPFSDVKAGSYYEKAVLWALANGVTKGTSSTTFSPNDNCTRAQIVTFLYRALGEPEVDTAENPFTDVKAGSYYEKAVLWAVANVVTKGKTSTTFDPNGVCTRGQAVTFLYRAFAE